MNLRLAIALATFVLVVVAALWHREAPKSGTPRLGAAVSTTSAASALSKIIFGTAPLSQAPYPARTVPDVGVTRTVCATGEPTDLGKICVLYLDPENIKQFARGVPSPAPPGFDPIGKRYHAVRVDRYGAVVLSQQSRDEIVKAIGAQMKAAFGIERAPGMPAR